MDSRNFAIGILSTTAVILLVGFFLVPAGSEPVWASGMTADGGDYVLTVGAGAFPDEELVYVIDAPSHKLIAYRFDSGRRQIEVVQGIDLAKLRDANTQQQTKPRGKKSGYGGRRRP